MSRSSTNSYANIGRTAQIVLNRYSNLYVWDEEGSVLRLQTDTVSTAGSIEEKLSRKILKNSFIYLAACLLVHLFTLTYRSGKQTKKNANTISKEKQNVNKATAQMKRY